MSATRRIAIIHDWLTGMRGGEKVLEVLCDIFPRADLFTLVYSPGKVSRTIERHAIRTSPLQRFFHVDRYYRRLLPLMPWAIEQFDFTGYDLLISTSHCVAKASIPPPGAKHWCYCHTPMRYIWDQYDQYFGPNRASLPVRGLMHLIRPWMQRWDVDTVPRVTEFIANSENVRERIGRLYHRPARVIYPPVDYDFYSKPVSAATPGEPFYLIVSALAPYKRIDLAIEAFTRLQKPLVIIGEGQESRTLRARAGSNIRFLGWLDNEELRDYYARCRGLIFPGEEDFGIVPLEAMSAGTPVIAFKKGGALETVIDGKTGLFFSEPTVSSFMEALNRFESQVFDRQTIQRHAETFGRAHCEAAFRQLFIEYQNEMS